MPLSDLFKSGDQKKREAKEASELKLFSEKRKLENQISILQRKKKDIQKRAESASSKDEEALISEFTRVTKDLNAYENALAQVKHLETGLRGSASGVDSLDSILANILVELDNLTEPEKTGGVSNEAKLKAEMNIQRKLATTPANSGVETLSRLNESVFLNEDEGAMSREDARAELFGGKTAGNAKILARMAEIEDEINS
jgi:phage shock protein A